MVNDNKQAQSAKTGATPAKPEAKKPELKAKDVRFKELAPKRTRGILKALEVLGNCSNKSGYQYTEDQVTKIFDTIGKKVTETKAMFSATQEKKDISFDL